MGIKWLQDWLGDPGDPLTTLSDWVRTKTPLLVEIENSLVRFQSTVNLSPSNSVLISKPDGLSNCLAIGKHVRVRRGMADRRELRLKITHPHLNLANGRAAFVCKRPDSVSQCRRKSERFDVSRYTNLRLVIGGDVYRLGDISADGFKILLSGMQHPHSFPIGQEMKEVRLEMGTNGRISLARVLPRSQFGRAVGCEYSVQEDGGSVRQWKLLLDSLARMNSSPMGA